MRTGTLSFAFIVPTLGNRGNVRRLLSSIHRQAVLPRQVILVDGGPEPLADDSELFPGLKLVYLRAPGTSLTQARNRGIAALAHDIDLAGFLDDDLVLEEGAATEMLRFWLGQGPLTAGCSFNIINTAPAPRSLLKYIFLLDTPSPGRVLPSGFTSQHFPARDDFRADWLCGGASVWRTGVFNEFLFDANLKGYSFPDDLDFSYPVSRRYALFVNARARVLHLHQEARRSLSDWFRLGMTHGRGRLYFISKHSALSLPLFLWASLGQILVLGLRTVVAGRAAYLFQAAGIACGIVTGLCCGRKPL